MQPSERRGQKSGDLVTRPGWLQHALDACSRPRVRAAPADRYWLLQGSSTKLANGVQVLHISVQLITMTSTHQWLEPSS